MGFWRDLFRRTKDDQPTETKDALILVVSFIAAVLVIAGLIAVF